LQQPPGGIFYAKAMHTAMHTAAKKYFAAKAMRFIHARGGIIMAKILIVEDEAKIARFVELELKYEGYEVEIAGDGESGLIKARKPGIDLLILDVMLPKLSGIEVCKKLREEGSNLPIIMLTAKDDIRDKVMGLDTGADDYMTKPFAIEELLARIRAALNRKSRMRESADTTNTSAKTTILTIGKLSLNTASYLVTYGEEELSLTKKEFELLAYLLRHRGEAITRDRLLSEVWEYEYMGDTNVVDVYVRYLRQKIDDRFGIKIISTVRGVGYIVK